MEKEYGLEYRKFVIAGVAIFIVIIYIIRLFTLQIMSEDYKKNADSNAFLKKVEYPARGVISDRNGNLLVYNQNAYDIVVVMNEEKGRIDTLEFCKALGITKEPESFVNYTDWYTSENAGMGACLVMAEEMGA